MGALAPPPVPNPDAQQGGALSAGPAPVPMAPGNAPGQPPQAPPQMPAPNHVHTVAALRHFAAIGGQLESALKDPDLGKADLKSKVIEGVTDLVARRIIAPAQAVQQLASFPEKPLDQKKWLMDHMQQVMQAREMVLGHHAMAFAGEPMPTQAPSADSHMSDMAGMMQAHYGARK
jgi:hypothetical protein